jgi:hypothetical protein
MFKMKKINFTFNLTECEFEIDTLQNRLLEFYLRADRRFRHAFNLNFTNDFIQFLKDKAHLREPVHISIMGNTRSGKSYIGITIALILMACYNKKFSVDYICANNFEFLEKLQRTDPKDLKDSVFINDEEKSVFGIGSLAKKSKIQDVANIIAINNISTINITPTRWSGGDGLNYGLRTFGRCFKTKTCRLMLYNLMEKGQGGELPLGNVYLPIFTALLPKFEADTLEQAYLKKKLKWVNAEQQGEGDVLETLKKKTAITFVKDKKFKNLTTKRDRITYISAKLGSEWTTGEVTSIESITKLLMDGVLTEKDF